MTTAPSANNRASLLSGLRTGGVRTSSATIPHTAAPGGTFNIPRIVSTSFNNEGQDYLADTSSQNMYGNRTAAVDGPNNRFTLQQQRGMNPNVAPFNPGFTPIAMTQANNAQAQQQALQMQMMQLEIMRMQVWMLTLPTRTSYQSTFIGCSGSANPSRNACPGAAPAAAATKPEQTD
jgi:hypothetical protein